VRLFTAIELGEGVQAEGAALVAELRQRAARLAPSAKITWVPAERLHLTLRFIGEVDDQRADQIVHALRAPVPLKPFVTRWEGLGAFPPKRAPRVLWVAVSHGAEQLARVYEVISMRLRAAGISDEDRPYSPHLTLARVRDDAGLRVSPLFEGLSGRLGETSVEAITLFQSKLSPKGPTYVALQRTPVRV
jgi:2'-5' RNA ligase